VKGTTKLSECRQFLFETGFLGRGAVVFRNLVAMEKAKAPRVTRGRCEYQNRRLHYQFYFNGRGCQGSSVMSSDRAEGEGLEP